MCYKVSSFFDIKVLCGLIVASAEFYSSKYDFCCAVG